MDTKITFQTVLKWTDEECRAYLERERWPNGPRCPKCGAVEPYRITRKSASKNAVQTLFKCKNTQCRKQFTSTVGTIFEDSKIPLSKWFAAIYLMCASKKGMSAHQIHRQLGITYKSAWFLCHRIREAMKDKSFPLLSGTIEADETYIHRRTRRGHKVMYERIKDEQDMGLREKPKHKAPYQDNPTVFGMLERDGLAKTMKVVDATSTTLKPIMIRSIDLSKSRLITDAHPAYRIIKTVLPHEVVNHEVEYVRGDVHTQGIENYWSLLKRGIVGTFHHIGEDYLPEYLQEFEYRYNRRKIKDEARFVSLVGQTQGRLTWYCKTPQPQNPFA